MSGRGRSIHPSPTRQVVGWRKYQACPTKKCGAAAGEPCKDLKDGGQKIRPHLGRVQSPLVSRAL